VTSTHTHTLPDGRVLSYVDCGQTSSSDVVLYLHPVQGNRCDACTEGGRGGVPAPRSMLGCCLVPSNPSTRTNLPKLPPPPQPPRLNHTKPGAWRSRSTRPPSTCGCGSSPPTAPATAAPPPTPTAPSPAMFETSATFWGRWGFPEWGCWRRRRAAW